MSHTREPTRDLTPVAFAPVTRSKQILRKPNPSSIEFYPEQKSALQIRQNNLKVLKDQLRQVREKVLRENDSKIARRNLKFQTYREVSVPTHIRNFSN